MTTTHQPTRRLHALAWREALVLAASRHGRLSINEIATRFAIPAPTVKSILRRLRGEPDNTLVLSIAAGHAWFDPFQEREL